MESNKEKASYCLGFYMGKTMKEQFKEVELKLALDGFSDAFTDAKPKLSEEEIKNILAGIQQQMEQQQKQFLAKMAEDNKREGEAFLQRNKAKPGITTLPSGLQYRILKGGTGPSPSLFDTVEIHFRSKVLDGTTFEDTYQQGKAQTIPIARCLPAWTEALKIMKVGDKWELFAPSYLAYGEAGMPPYIPPNMTLIFELELVAIK